MPRLAIIILTFNEERHIGACLDSLAGVEAPIFVVDSFSTDRTVDLLKERQITFVQRPFLHYADQRNWAQQHCPFQSEWVLHIDAGERLTPELSHWLRNRFDPDGAPDGIMFSRRTLFLRKWIRYGGHYPSYHLRLFRIAKGHCEQKAYDQHFVCQGATIKAPTGLDLYDLVSDNLADFTTRHTRWAIMEAVEKVSRAPGRGEVRPRLYGTPIERRRWLKHQVFGRAPLFLRAVLYFGYRYFLRLGFLDGGPGLVFHFLQGCWFRFLVDSVVLEIRREQDFGNGDLRETIARLYGEKFCPPEQV